MAATGHKERVSMNENSGLNRAKLYQLALFPMNNGATNVYFVLILSYVATFGENILGLKLERTNDPERLRECLRTGGAAVVHVGGDYEGHVGVFSHGGHYVAAIAEEADGRIAILDPSYKLGKNGGNGGNWT